MRFALWMAAGVWVTFSVCRMRLLRRCGWPGAAQRLYRRTAWCVGCGVWCMMLLQETVLWRSGQLTWRTGLPLHLCSLTGVLTLPMLLGGSRWLWSFALYAGLPGAALAMLFPAVTDTPWPRLTALGFYGMHALLTFAPLLPLGLGRKPKGRDALRAGVVLAAAGCAAMAANALTGGNYLFLAGPVAGTPLTLLAGGTAGHYRLRLALAGLAVLALEGCAAWIWRRQTGRR